MKKLLLIFAFVPVLLFSQTRKQRKALEAQRKADQVVINNFKNHVKFLSINNDSTSSLKDDGPTVEYISNQFKTIGLEPKGTNGYIQQFKIDEGKQISTGTSLKVNGTLLAVKKEYFPLSFSASKSVTGMPAMALKEKGVPWFTDIKDWLEDSTTNTDFDKTIQKEAVRAASKGATALFLFNSSKSTDNVRFNNRDKTPALSIPVIYITSEGYNKYFNDQSQVLDVELNVAFRESIKNATNVVGYINKNAPSNIVIAAPYTPTNQEKITGEADNQKIKGSADLASGTSMLIELARMLSSSKAKNNNYTFIAYNGEDTLSQNSKWLNDPAITSNASYIINLDKVSRYDEDKKLSIESYGTSQALVENIKPLADQTLELNFDSVQQRDASFHQVKVPVLNFCTNKHVNDTKASTGSNQINYEGELHIARFIYRLIEATGSNGKLAFLEKNEDAISKFKLAQPVTASVQ